MIIYFPLIGHVYIMKSAAIGQKSIDTGLDSLIELKSRQNRLSDLRVCVLIR